MRRIVVGAVDRPSARSALAWASSVASGGAAIIAVDAFESPYAETPPEIYDRLVAERTDEVAARCRQVAPSAELTVVARIGEPTEVLLAVAESMRADLLVLGRGGANGHEEPGLFHTGSVVEHAAHHSAIPVAVVPAGAAAQVTEVLVGVDDSPETAAAVRFATELSSATGARARAVHVDGAAFESAPVDHLREHLAAWTEPLAQAGIDLSTEVVRHHSVTEGLIEQAGHLDAGVLVVGTKALSEITGLRAGGTAPSVLHAADGVTLVLVPAGWESGLSA